MPSNPNSIVFPPRVLPRSIADFAITTFAVLPIQVTALFFAPSAFAFLVSGSSEVAFLVAASIYFIFLLFSVWSIAVSQDGIRFKRLLGDPKLLPWSEVLSVTEASRSELITKGWLWPLFPAREMTACLSSVRHYKISWNGGFCFYPPADTLGFEKHVEEHLSRREA